jgi:hypothetical protein
MSRAKRASSPASLPGRTKDGGTLRTIREACNYKTGIGKQRELRSQASSVGPARSMK